jgi:hypothetical protein
MKSLKIYFAFCLFLALVISGFAQQTEAPQTKTKSKAELKKVIKKLDADQQQALLKIAKKLDEDESGKFLEGIDMLMAIYEMAPSKEGIDLPPTRETTSPPPPAPRKPVYQEKAEAMKATSVEFENEEYDFGKAKDGEIVRHTFTFTNTGKDPLTIQRAKASCGCTVPTWSKEPIAPGESGSIDIEFNTTHKVGLQTKTVIVTGNFEGNINKVLRIKGEVLPSQD